MYLSIIIIRNDLGIFTLKEIIKHPAETFCERINNLNNVTIAGVPNNYTLSLQQETAKGHLTLFFPS